MSVYLDYDHKQLQTKLTTISDSLKEMGKAELSPAQLEQLKQIAEAVQGITKICDKTFAEAVKNDQVAVAERNWDSVIKFPEASTELEPLVFDGRAILDAPAAHRPVGGLAPFAPSKIGNGT
ncbi:MAG: hypothetical protein WCD70_13160 [Alphaproteobacteria bacterium]